jgi:hypothetical protein
MLVAGSMGVEEQIKSLMGLSQKLRENELEVSDCVAGLDIIEKLRHFGVDPSNIEDFISSVYTESNNQDLKPIELVALCTELRRIKKEAGKSYPEIVEEYQSLKESNQVLSGENVRLEEERRENIRSLREQVKEKETTLETLGWFAGTRDKLRELGVGVEDLDDLALLIKNFSESDYDAVEIIEFYSESVELRNKMRELEGDVKSQEQKLRSLVEENERCEEILKSNHELVAAVEDLESMHLNKDRVQTLIEKTSEISAIHGLKHTEALEKFFSDLSEQYEPKLGYENQLARYSSNITRLEQDIHDKKDDLSRLEGIVSSKESIVASLNQLNESGVTNEDLVHWSNIVKKTNLDLVTIRREIAQLGGLRQWFEKKGEEKIKLSGQIESMEREIESLRLQKENYETELTSLTTGTLADVKQELQKIPEIIDKLRTDFLSPETGMKAESLKLVNNTHKSIRELLTNKEKQWTELLSNAEAKIEKMSGTLDDLSRAIYEAGKMVGEYKALKPIHILQSGEDPGYIEGLTAILAIIVHFRDWFKKHSLSLCQKACSDIMNCIEEELRGISKIG